MSALSDTLDYAETQTAVTGMYAAALATSPTALIGPEHPVARRLAGLGAALAGSPDAAADAARGVTCDATVRALVDRRPCRRRSAGGRPASQRCRAPAPARLDGTGTSSSRFPPGRHPVRDHPTVARLLGIVVDLPSPGLTVLDPGGSPATLPLPPGQPLPAGQYLVHDTDNPVVPYLIDPGSRGATLAPVPGQPVTAGSAPATVTYSGQGPDQVPAELRLVAGGPAGQGRSPRERAGGRGWLRRPWMTTGPGEALGVVVWSSVDFATLLQNTPFNMQQLSRWGVDLLEEKGPRPDQPFTAGSFPAGEAHREGLVEISSVNEAPGNPPATVVAHEVRFDPERQQWFADVDVDIPGGRPALLRLGLVRYELESPGGARVSRMVTSGWIPLQAPRTMTIRSRSGTGIDYDGSLTGKHGRSSRTPG